VNPTPIEKNALPQVLLVDDDPSLCEMLCEYLSADGFEVNAVHDGQAGVDAVRAAQHDVVVMDITMPVLDGFGALRKIREFSTIPVLILTARGDELDRIVGLEIGADDYLPKPFNPRELSARLRAIMRRVRPVGGEVMPEAVLSEGDLCIQTGARSVQIDAGEVPVTSTEYSIIELLLRKVGQIVSKDELSEHALGRRLLPYDRSLDTHMANLRKKLGNLADGKPRIKTVRGQGYLLVRRDGGDN